MGFTLHYSTTFVWAFFSLLQCFLCRLLFLLPTPVPVTCSACDAFSPPHTLPLPASPPPHSHGSSIPSPGSSLAGWWTWHLHACSRLCGHQRTSCAWFPWCANLIVTGYASGLHWLPQYFPVRFPLHLHCPLSGASVPRQPPPALGNQLPPQRTVPGPRLCRTAATRDPGILLPPL